MAYQPIHTHYHLFGMGWVVPSVIARALHKSCIFSNYTLAEEKPENKDGVRSTPSLFSGSTRELRISMEILLMCMGTLFFFEGQALHR